jgi:hypothetical protein
MAERMTGEEAIAWLKESGKTPDLRMFWDVAESDDPAVMNGILDILFRPQSSSDAA